jgi:C4-dicarboxylate-specific signal transduction histidine kinase
MMTRRNLFSALIAASVMSVSWYAQAQLPADFQAKAEEALKRLQILATDSAVIAATKSGTSAVGMNNAKWTDLPETDATVSSMGSGALAEKLAEARIGTGKLNLRDKDGNLVAFAKGSEKPFLFNVANRPNFKAALEGNHFIGGKVAPDPTSQKPSVQVAAPVKDGDQVIGMIHSSVE